MTTVGATQVGMLLGGNNRSSSHSYQDNLSTNLNGALGYSSIADTTSIMLNEAYSEHLPSVKTPTPLENLRKFAQEYMADDDAKKLIATIDAVQDLHEFVSSENYADRVADLLSGRKEGAGSFGAGLLINALF
ncbi:MAG: hypothetical protein MRY32_08435 [Rickettsiales bacterium]|nr:hypothetical protein [Rickettsiales bacterium]